MGEGTGTIFSGIGCATVTFGQTEQGGRVVSLMGEAVTGGYLPLLGLEPALGRNLLPEDDVVGGDRFVVMLGYDFWQSTYGGDTDILDRTIPISGDAYQIVVVAPRDYPARLPRSRPDDGQTPGNGRSTGRQGELLFLSFGTAEARGLRGAGKRDAR